MTPAQRELLEDKLALWRENSTSGNMELRDYNRRCAEALEAVLTAWNTRLATVSTTLAEGEKTIEILRRALAWHGDPQRMATTREEWQQEIDAAILWVRQNPEPDRPSFSSLAALSLPLNKLGDS